MSEGERRGRRRRRKRRRSSRFGWPRTTAARVVAAGALVAILALPIVLWAARRPDSGVPTGRAYHVARMALGDGDLDTALREARAAVAEDPDSREARLLLALVLRERGATEEAAALLDADVRRDLDYDDGRVLLAAFAVRDGDYAAALTLLREATARDPTPAGAWRLLGDVRSLTGNRAGAVSAYRQGVEQDPDDLRTWLALADVHLAAALDSGSVVAREDAGQAYAAAEGIARRLLRSRPSRELRLALAKSLAGRARALRGTSLAQAEAELRALVEDTGGDADAVLALAEFLAGTGRDSDARRVLEDAERRGGGAALRRSLARVLESLGEVTEAAAALRRALAADAGDVTTRVELVRLLARAGRHEEAAAIVGQAPEGLDPAWPLDEVAGDLARDRARLSEAAGDDERAQELRAAALAAYERALAARPRSMPLQKKRFAEMLEAGALRPDALTDEAREAAQGYVTDVLALNPGDVDALGWRARLLLLEGRPEDAHAVLADVAQSEAPPVELLRLYGTACERTGRDELAADAFERALARVTRRGEAQRDDRAAPPGMWGDAARAALRAGRATLARSTAESAVAAWPESLELRLLLASARMHDGRSAEALSTLAAARAAFPGTDSVPLLEAAVHELAGRPDDAERVLRDALAVRDGADLRLALGALLGRSGRIVDMLEVVTAALELAGEDERSLVRAGDALLGARPPQAEAACGAYERASRVASDPRPSLVRLAEARLVLVDEAHAADTRAAAAAEAAAAVQRCEAVGVDEGALAYLRGRLALTRGDAGEAVAQLTRAAETGQDSAATLFHLGRALRATGRDAEARAALETARDRVPGDAAVLAELRAARLAEAYGALAAGRSAEALLLLGEGSSAVHAPLLAAAARAGRGDLRLAEPLLRDRVAASPGDGTAAHLLAAVLVRQGGAARFREAESVWSDLLRREPSDVHALAGRAAARDLLGRHAEAAEDWDRACALRPGDHALLRGLVASLAADGRVPEAVARVEAATKEDDEAGELRALRADLLLQTGRHAEAVRAYREVIAAAPGHVAPLLGAAASLVALDRPGDALDLLEEQVARCEDPRPVWRAIGELRARAGEVDEARRALERAGAGAVPTGFDVLLRGEVAEAAGEHRRARELYEATVRMDAWRVPTLRRLAALLAAAGESRRALDVYDDILRVLPDDAAAVNNRALLLADEPGRLSDALDGARHARELAPGLPQIADTLGWLLVRSGSSAEALPLLQEAAAELYEDPLVLFHLGVCQARLGSEEDARRHLERALALDPGFPGSEAARAQLDRLR